MAQRIPLALRYMKMIDDEIEVRAAAPLKLHQMKLYLRTVAQTVASQCRARLMRMPMGSTFQSAADCLESTMVLLGQRHSPTRLCSLIVLEVSLFRSSNHSILTPTDLASMPGEGYEQLFQFNPFSML
jgi:hypothetical protein